MVADAQDEQGEARQFHPHAAENILETCGTTKTMSKIMMPMATIMTAIGIKHARP